MADADPSTRSSMARESSLYRQVARLHMEGINQGFLPQLGLQFMTLLYEAIDRCPDSVLLVEVDGEKVLGFVAGAASMKPIYRQLLRSFFPLLLALLPSLFRPARLRRIFEIMRYGSHQAAPEKPTLPAFELLSIAVAREARGTGCADRLYTRLAEFCHSHGIMAFKIIVGDSLTPAHRFYQRMGARSACRMEVHAGHGSEVYVYQIPNRTDA